MGGTAIGSSGGIRRKILNALTLIKYEHRVLARGKKLTGDGVQWCAGDEGANDSYTTTSVGTLEEAFKQYINPKVSGEPNWVEIGLTIGLKASADNSAGKWKWQGSVNGSDWEDLSDLVTEADIDIAEFERTRQGFALLSIITAIPFYIRLMVQCDTAGQTVTTRAKSSSYATPVYQAT